MHILWHCWQECLESTLVKPTRILCWKLSATNQFFGGPWSLRCICDVQEVSERLTRLLHQNGPNHTGVNRRAFHFACTATHRLSTCHFQMTCCWQSNTTGWMMGLTEIGHHHPSDLAPWAAYVGSPHSLLQWVYTQCPIFSEAGKWVFTVAHIMKLSLEDNA